MQLTNFTFLQSRNDYMSSIAQRKIASDRASGGKMLERSGEDVGALSHAAKLNLESKSDRLHLNNLRNAQSFLHAQEQGLHRTLQIYGRMEELAQMASTPFTNQSDRNNYENEFQSLKAELNQLAEQKLQGRPLYNKYVYCGEPASIDYGELNLAPGWPPPWDEAIISETKDIGMNSGTVNFRVNSGRGGDIYRVWLGDTLLMSMGGMPDPSLDHTQTYYNLKAGQTAITDPYPTIPSGFSGNGWRTSGGALNGDADLVTLSFGPGIETTYKITPGGTNDDGAEGSTANDGISDYNNHTGNGKYDNIYVLPSMPLDFDATSTMLTLQVETQSVGIIYGEGNSASSGTTSDGISKSGVVFTPELPPITFAKDSHGNDLSFVANGFDLLEERSIASSSSAKETFDALNGTTGKVGEIQCLLTERIGALASESRRLGSEIEAMESQVLNGEVALGRITDADLAREATALAKESMKSQMAARVISESTKLKDLFIPLTTNHFRGAPLSSSL